MQISVVVALVHVLGWIPSATATPDRSRGAAPPKPQPTLAEAQAPQQPPPEQPAVGPTAEPDWKALQRRCDNQEVQACLDLAQMSGAGKGPEPEWKAIQRRCNAKEIQACFDLAQMYWDGKVTGRWEDTMAMADFRNALAIDKEQARASQENACAAGKVSGCFNLGLMYAKGEGAAQDKAKAAALYQNACDAKFALACNNLGLMYANGESLAQDKAKAAALYQKACDAKFALACNNLGWMLEHGEGVAQDKTKAAALYQRACGAEIALACNNLRLMKDNRANPADGKPADARGVEPSNSPRADEGGVKPADFQERHGVYAAAFSFAAGAAYAKVGSPGARAASGVVRSTLLVRLAVEITPDLLVGVDYQGLVMNLVDSDPYLSNVSATATYYPIETRGWYARGGPGLLIYKETQDKAAAYGASLILGTGYEARVFDRVALGVEANYAVGRASGATCQMLGGLGVVSFFF